MNEAASFAIRVRDVWKSYPRRPVLQGITGDFSPGRIVVLVGPNGAGKTTFMRIIAGLQFADRGSVEARDSVYFGGFDTLPLKGRAQELRRALGIPEEGRFAERRLSKLSRGELQWVGVNAALALDRPVTLLDEPWTALEPDIRENLNGTLRKRASREHCIVCSTHELDEAVRVADDILFLRDGRVLWMAREQTPGGIFDRNALLSLFRDQGN